MLMQKPLELKQMPDAPQQEGLVSPVARDGMEDIIKNQQAPTSNKASLILAARLKLMRREARQAKMVHTRDWGLYGGFYRGNNHWTRKMPSWKVPGSINFVQQLVERKAALLTDAKPIIRIMPNLALNATPTQKEQAEDTSQILTKIIESVWYEHSLDQRLARAVVYAEVFGGVGIKTDIDLDRGRTGADPTFFVIDPRALGFDPHVYASEDLYRCEYMYVDDIRSTGSLKVKYGNHVRPSGKYAASGTLDSDSSLRSKIRNLMGNGEATAASSAIDRTEITSFYLKDYTMDAYMKREFPNGRYVLVGDEIQILADKPLEDEYLDGQSPLDFMEWHFDLNSVWGFGDVELYKAPQDMFNKLISTIVENASLMTNNIWMGDADALAPEDWKKLTNAPGGHVKVRPGRRLERVGPPALSPGLFNLLNLMMGGLEKLSGIPPGLEGRQPGQIASGVGLDSMNFAAQTVVRFKARQLESLLMRVGQKLIARIFQHMDDYRVFNLVGDADKVLKYHWERKKHLTDPEFSFRDFSFSIVPGSSLSSSKFQKGQQAMQLFQLGLIKNPQRVLEAMEDPDAQDIQKENEMISQNEREFQMQLAKAGMLGKADPGGNKPQSSQQRGSSGAGGRHPGSTVRSPQTGPKS